MLALILAASMAVDPAPALTHYEQHESKHLVPMLQQVLQFPTEAGNVEAHASQKAWLLKAASDLGFVGRDAGKVTEIELPGPESAPVLGLVIHGDVQPAEAEAWTFPPYEGRVENGYVLGRGAADDKGPLVQALLAMKALQETKAPLTHTIRLLVGSEEESSATDFVDYLATHKAPDYSLVLDSEFPVVVGEKAWDGLGVMASLDDHRGGKPYRVAAMDAGLAPSIVPDRAEVRLRWIEGTPDWTSLANVLRKTKMPEGTRLVVGEEGEELRVVAYGKSAHAGVNLTGGRNALVALARALEGKLPDGGANDLLAFARVAGQDLYGTALGITETHPVWGRYAVNVATIKPRDDEHPREMVLFTNLRRTPPRNAAQAQAHLEQQVAAFNQRNKTKLAIVPERSYFADEPLVFDPNAKIVKRLMGIYATATGEKNPKPAISGGGTYAKRIPNAIAFGMWFPGKPYPGHDVDEKIAIDDLQRGARVLIHALVDVATGPKIEGAFVP